MESLKALIQICDMYLTSELIGGNMTQAVVPPRFQLSFDQREAYQVSEHYLKTNDFHPPYAVKR